MKRSLFALSVLLSLVATPSFAQGVKISALPSATTVTGAEVVPIVQGGVNKQATLSQFGNDILRTKYGAKGDGVTDDTVALKAFLSSCPPQTLQNQTGVALAAFPGVFRFTDTLKQYCNVNWNGATLLYDGPAIVSAYNLGDENYRYANGGMHNFTLKMNNSNAQYALWIRKNASNDLTNFRITGEWQANAIHIGDNAITSGNGYGTSLHTFRIERNQDNVAVGNPPVGSSAIFIESSPSDIIMENGEIKGGEVAITTLGGHSRYSLLHLWGKGMKTCVSDQGNANIWDGVQFDSCMLYGIRMTGLQTQITNSDFLQNDPLNDNLATAIKFDQTSPGATIVGNLIRGATSSARWIKDIDVSGPTGNSIGFNSISNIVTPFFCQLSVYQPGGGNFTYCSGALGVSSGGPFYLGAANATHMILSASSTGKVQVKNPLVLSAPAAGNSTVIANGGELVMDTVTPTATAVGAGSTRYASAAGTVTGTTKLVAYSGTSTVAYTVADNIGAAVKYRVAESSQTASPADTGTVVSDGSGVLLLSPAGTINTVTVTLPANPIDRQVFTLTSNNNIANVIINGGTVNGTAPTSIAAGGFYSWVYLNATAKWVRIG